MRYYNQNLQWYLLTKLSVVILFTMLIKAQKPKQDRDVIGSPLSLLHPCKENDRIILIIVSDLPTEERNQYMLYIPGNFTENSQIEIKFDSEASVALDDTSNARITKASDVFNIDIIEFASSIDLKIHGLKTGTIPHIQSLVINNVENCKDPKLGMLDRSLLTEQNTEDSLNLPDGSCGKRKVIHTELIVSGQSTKPGDWPWHAAIYILDGYAIKYICGGTLISKTVVITAAHCVTIRGFPRITSSLSVILGKYNLIGGDIDPQEREVQQIIVHEQYEYHALNNDIALLKLKSEVNFTDYVQPACLWSLKAYKRLPHRSIKGTGLQIIMALIINHNPADKIGTRRRPVFSSDEVRNVHFQSRLRRRSFMVRHRFLLEGLFLIVGWGFDQTKQLSLQLQQAKMPKVSELACIKSHPLFFSRLLNAQKFCAGYRNGTSACNGDSGGGFVVFVPDAAGDTSANATGAWHVRGIISTSVSRNDEPICDPNHYVLFTDLAKFRGWISRNMN